MSDNQQGALSFIAEEFARHAALPPPQKAASRTVYGSTILVACGYTAFTLGPDALHPPPVLLGFAAVAGFGLLLFVVGLRGPRMPAEFMTKFWSLFWAVAFGAGCWALAVYLPDWWDNIFVRGFCISFAAAQSIDFLLLFRPAAGNAEKIIKQQIDQSEINWKPVNTR